MPRALGIDLGGTKIEGVVVDAAMRPLVRTRIPTEQDRGYEHILDGIVRLVDELRPLVPDIERIGVGTPGSLSGRDGTLKNSNTACLNGRWLDRDLEARLGLGVRLENDANCFALAEALAGAGTGHRLVFGVILGTGVGGGIVYDGVVWAGPQHVAGEWGHLAIDPAGEPCYCGRRGCVETLCSGPALEARYPGLDAAEIGARASAGDARAVAALDDYLDAFGRGLANVINVLDPDVVVLGGGLSNLDVLYSRGREAVARHVFNDELRTPIVPNRLGDSAGVLGAALLAMTR